MKNYVLMGMPASGKGTLSKQLSELYGVELISTGDLLRKEQAEGTKIGKMADALINVGKFMPDNIVITMVRDSVIRSSNDQGFVFDGFPRTQDQAKQLHAFLLQNKTPIDKVIYIDVSERVAMDRIKKRAEAENRPDDDPQVVLQRMEEYRKNTEPVLGFFEKKGLLLRVDGNQPKEAVLKQVQDELALAESEAK